MTDTREWTEPLDPAGIIGESFGVISRNIGIVAAATLAPAIVIGGGAFALGYYFP